MPNYCYFRIKNPDEFYKETFRTIKVSEYDNKPIYLTIGKHKGLDKYTAQRIMYPLGHPLCKYGGTEITKGAMKEYIINKYGKRAKYIMKQRGLALLEALDIKIPQDLTPLGKIIFYSSLAGLIYLIYKIIK